MKTNLLLLAGFCVALLAPMIGAQEIKEPEKAQLQTKEQNPDLLTYPLRKVSG